MKRLAKENKNTSHEYDRIFKERQKNGIDRQDRKRWKKLLQYYKGGNLIDIGCLDSNIPRVAKTFSPDSDIWGIDVAAKAILEMQQRNPDINYRVYDLFDNKFSDGYFEYVVLGEVLEHLEEPRDAIKEAMRILNIGGVLAVSTPLNEAREKGAVDAERHVWSFTIKDMVGMLKEHGRVTTSTLGSQYFPKYVYHYPTLLAWCKKK